MSALSFLHTFANKALAVMTQDIEPAIINFFKSFSHDVVQQVMPIAVAELANVESAAVAAATSGNWDGFGTAVGTATSATIAKSVGIVENAGVNDAITAVNVAIANHTGIQAAVAAAPSKGVGAASTDQPSLDV